MQKTLTLLGAVVAVMAVWAHPIRESVGTQMQSMIDDVEPQNLWVWPTDMISVSANPAKVWTPLIGIWYSGVAVNGYCNKNFYSARTFTDSSFHNVWGGGYAMVQFFELESGRYNIAYDFIGGQDTDNLSSFILIYEEVEGGYLFSRKKLISRTILNHGDFKSAFGMFDVPDDNVLIGIWIATAAGSRECDVWNVVLTKVEN